MRDLRIVGAGKEYKEGKTGPVVALDKVELHARAGELLALVGPSGCGKTTLLRTIAGLDELSSGEIYLGSERIDLLPPGKRSISMAFQQAALYPQMTVGENIAFPLTLRKVPAAEKSRRVKEVAELARVSALMKRLPETLSGGEQQRVALARALVVSPEVLLLDEPLSNLDAQTRVELRREVASLQRGTGVTCIFVTHDQTEAMALGDRVAVMNTGKIIQCSAPADLYQKPATRFVAGFIGYPAMNFFSARVEDGKLNVGQPKFLVMMLCDGVADNREIVAGIRSEDVVISTQGVEAITEKVEELGHEAHAHCQAGGNRFVMRVRPGEVRTDEKVRVEFRPDRWHLFEVESGKRIG